MKKIQLCVLSLLSTLWLVVGVGAAVPSFTTLQPGQTREINQELPINIVFIGYHQGVGPREINEAVFRAGLPGKYRTLNVGPSSYIPSNAENDQVWVGNSFSYNYNITYADQAFE